MYKQRNNGECMRLASLFLDVFLLSIGLTELSCDAGMYSFALYIAFPSVYAFDDCLNLFFFFRIQWVELALIVAKATSF